MFLGVDQHRYTRVGGSAEVLAMAAKHALDLWFIEVKEAGGVGIAKHNLNSRTRVDLRFYFEVHSSLSMASPNTKRMAMRYSVHVYWASQY